MLFEIELPINTLLFPLAVVIDSPITTLLVPEALVSSLPISTFPAPEVFTTDAFPIAIDCPEVTVAPPPMAMEPDGVAVPPKSELPAPFPHP